MWKDARATGELVRPAAARSSQQRTGAFREDMVGLPEL